jgi:hypothetical protein
MDPERVSYASWPTFKRGRKTFTLDHSITTRHIAMAIDQTLTEATLVSDRNSNLTRRPVNSFFIGCEGEIKIT